MGLEIDRVKPANANCPNTLVHVRANLRDKGVAVCGFNNLKDKKRDTDLFGFVVAPNERIAIEELDDFALDLLTFPLTLDQYRSTKGGEVLFVPRIDLKEGTSHLFELDERGQKRDVRDRREIRVLAYPDRMFVALFSTVGNRNDSFSAMYVNQLVEGWVPQNLVDDWQQGKDLVAEYLEPHRQARVLMALGVCSRL